MFLTRALVSALMVLGMPWLTGRVIMVALPAWKLVVSLVWLVVVLLAVRVQAGAALVVAHAKQE